LLGPDAPGLSAATVRRLVSAWQDEHQRWQGRDLSAKRYVYVWADGIYFAPRLEHARQCMLVLIGADAGGKKELCRRRAHVAAALLQHGRPPYARLLDLERKLCCTGCGNRRGNTLTVSMAPRN
jgi:Transposase, Mutator family